MEEAFLRSLVVIVHPVHGRPVVHDYKISGLPFVAIDELRANRRFRQTIKEEPAFLRCFADDVRGLQNMEIQCLVAGRRVRARKRMVDRFSEIPSVRVLHLELAIERIDSPQGIKLSPGLFRQSGIDGTHVGKTGIATAVRHRKRIQYSRLWRAFAVCRISVHISAGVCSPS